MTQSTAIIAITPQRGTGFSFCSHVETKSEAHVASWVPQAISPGKKWLENEINHLIHFQAFTYAERSLTSKSITYGLHELHYTVITNATSHHPPTHLPRQYNCQSAFSARINYFQCQLSHIYFTRSASVSVLFPQILFR
jgi:hypothetical protein